MSRSGSRITQDPRVMVAVLVVLAAMVAINLRGFLPKGAAADLAVSVEKETLVPPSDFRHVGAVLRARLAEPPTGGALPMPASLGRNPFAYGVGTLSVTPAPGAAEPTPRADESGPRLRCTALILGGGESAAIIDGKLLHVGDAVADYRIVAIDEDGVFLRAGERTRVLAVRRSRGAGAVGAPVAQD
ncbi:hypothetical protein FJ251_07260 [bacterium]|nr:hypothetical protein [bacterium]